MMPTYNYRCAQCGDELEAFRTLSEYLKNPLPFFHCAQAMARRLCVMPGMAVHNPLASDRHYEGLRTLDGVDVSSRTKHRAYMKERGLTTVDDYRGEWQRAAEARAQALEGIDPTRRADIGKAIDELVSR